MPFPRGRVPSLRGSDLSDQPTEPGVAPSAHAEFLWGSDAQGSATTPTSRKGGPSGASPLDECGNGPSSNPRGWPPFNYLKCIPILLPFRAPPITPPPWGVYVAPRDTEDTPTSLKLRHSLSGATPGSVLPPRPTGGPLLYPPPTQPYWANGLRLARGQGMWIYWEQI